MTSRTGTPSNTSAYPSHEHGSIRRQNRHLNMADEDICLETRALKFVLWSKTSVV
jgi:hypothetical protein